MEPICKNVTSIQFSIMSPEEIRKSSVVEVTKFETYDKDVPVIKGLFDIRMGTTDMGKVCNTCGQTNINCPGHFGHIELVKPVYHYHLVHRLVKILKCVCIRCSKLLVNKNSNIIDSISKKPAKARWNEIYNLSSKITRCGQETEDGCGCSQPHRYKVDGIKGISAVWKLDEGFDQDITVEYIKSVLEKISDEDCNLLGFSDTWCRPEWMICSVLPVPPPSVRPSVKQDNSQRMDDDLTHKLSDIVKYNNGLKHKLNTNSRPEIIQDWTDMLQYHVGTLIDNELSGINQSTHRSGRPLKAIRQRLKGKEGRIRSNLMGKRVDFSARSVITPDPNIELDQLGVPIKIAMNLTYPEKVNDYNKHRLNDLLQNGSDVWPGIKNIIKKSTGIKISVLENNKDDIILENGDIVNRHLIDNDYVLFNRQPSLHKMSMMAHRVKVMKGNTFRLNISVTPPYNADFDGDEMNMHVPQSISAVSELINIASVYYQIVSPRSNKPIITLVQDTLLGLNKLTSSEVIQFSKYGDIHYSNNTTLHSVKDVRNNSDLKLVQSCYFTKTQIMNILCDVSTFQGIIPEPEERIDIKGTSIELWSGRQIITFILPENVNLETPNSNYDNNKESTEVFESDIKNEQKKQNNSINIIKIVNGILEKGTFDKSTLTKTSKGLIHTMYNDFGPARTADFINDLQKIITYFLLLDGFSVGISDMIADNNTNEKIYSTIKDRTKQIEVIMQELHLDIFEGIPGQSKRDFFESKVNSILNKTRKETGKIGLSNLDPMNRVIRMINSGSKGNDLNIAQMVACLGQQNVDGKRIPYGFADRTLPHYNKYDDSAEARGFVENSFISGQTPQEFFFHAMGGREGLIDTAVKTSETGYIQRKLVKAMEDLMVHHDYSVRSSSGSIVQFVYGNDGMDGTYIESQPLLLTKYSVEEIQDKINCPIDVNWDQYLTTSSYNELLKHKNYKQIILENNKKILNHRAYLYSTIFKRSDENNINFPVHIQRIVSNICTKSKASSDITPIDIISMNETLVQELFVREEFKNNKIMEILLDVHLSPKKLIIDHHITKDEYTMIHMLIKQQYYKSKISPGEMVGVVAAQSIGEPATQMTLNTFHYAGVSAKSKVTRGIPRLKELIHISKNIKAPSASIYLRDDFRYDKQKSQFVKNEIEFTLLKDIVLSSKIYYDPVKNIIETTIEEDKELLDIYKQFQILESSEEEDISPWIIRFEFNKELMMEKGIILEDVYLALMKYDSECIRFIYTDDNASKLIGRLSIKIDSTTEKNGLQDQSDIISSFKNINEDIMNNVIIRGINNITDVIVNEINYIEKQDNNIVKVKNYTLETDGTNLLDIFNYPLVNYKETISNDILEIYNLLGIEAARNILIEEITGVFEEYINNRHIELLCDIMTCKGVLIQINRQGVDRGDIGPLAKCSFEDTTDQLIKASIFGEKDNLLGVSSNIMLGQVIPCGTGLSEILLDEEKLIQELDSLRDSDQEDYEEVNETNIDSLLVTEEDDECNDDNLKFDFE